MNRITVRAILTLTAGLLASSATATCAFVEREAVCEAGAASGEVFASVDCNLCASESCCAESTACAAEPGCAELMTCLKGCAPGDAGCFADCRKNVSHDEALADGLLTCVATRCESAACPIEERMATCAEAGTVPDVFGIFACDLCVRQRACGVATACADNADCAARIACMSECTGADLNPACFDLCRDDGVFDVGDANFFAEVARECREECRIGTSFECVDNFTWPTTTKQRVDVTHQALDRTAGDAPFVGLDVTACAGQAGACDPVGMPEVVQTDGSGTVVVNVPTGSGFEPDNNFGGFKGYLRWERNPPDPMNWLPTILQHMRPEYRDRLGDEIAPFAAGSLLTSLINLVANDRMVMVDENRGVLLGGMVDCHGTVEFFAPDISLEISNADDQTQIVYVTEDMLFLDFDATSTTVAGQFVAINVPPGIPNVILRDEPSGAVYADTTVNIVGGEVTVLAAWPQEE